MLKHGQGVEAVKIRRHPADGASLATARRVASAGCRSLCIAVLPHRLCPYRPTSHAGKRCICVLTSSHDAQKRGGRHATQSRRPHFTAHNRAVLGLTTALLCTKALPYPSRTNYARRRSLLGQKWNSKGPSSPRRRAGGWVSPTHCSTLLNPGSCCLSLAQHDS